MPESGHLPSNRPWLLLSPLFDGLVPHDAPEREGACSTPDPRPACYSLEPALLHRAPANNQLLLMHRLTCNAPDAPEQGQVVAQIHRQGRQRCCSFDRSCNGGFSGLATFLCLLGDCLWVLRPDAIVFCPCVPNSLSDWGLATEGPLNQPCCLTSMVEQLLSRPATASPA